MSGISVNERIKQVRQSLNLSQITFSKGIFLSNGYFAGIELGNRKANNRIIELISSKYGVNRQWLETGKGEMFAQNPPDAGLEQILTIFKELNPVYKDFLLNFLKQLRKLQDTCPKL
jgi:transcriptional regulator with XRE-family HTH domain